MELIVDVPLTAANLFFFLFLCISKLTYLLLLQVWKFSPAFSPVYSWHFVDVPSMSDHMKKCPFFNRAELKTEPVPLTAMCTEQDRLSILHCYQTLRSLIA